MVNFMLASSVAITLVHCVDELDNNISGYFGRLAGKVLPKWVKYGVFFAGSIVLLIACAWGGLRGSLPIVGQLPERSSELLLGVLAGTRFGDALSSHWHWHLRGYRPNPGLWTSLLGVVECCWLITIVSDGVSFGFGAVAAVTVFAVLVPLLETLPFQGQKRAVPGVDWRSVS